MLRENIYQASANFFLAPIQGYLADPSVTEIMVNGPERIYVERRGKIVETDAHFQSEETLRSAISNIAQWVGREVDEQRPILDARLPNGSRVHAVLPPGATGGTYLTIRKFSRDFLTLADLVKAGSLSEPAREFLEIAVRLRKNILLSGGTGSGKTSLLNALSDVIPEEERVIVIEDTSELKLRQRHALYLEARPPDERGRGALTVRQLFTASLRMRPDRLVVGEVRGGEALDLVGAMLSGHAGSLSTLHASSPRDALIRLETLSLMAGIELPVYVARAQVASAVHLVAQLTRFPEDGSRRVTRITEARGLSADNQYELVDLFIGRPKGRRSDGRLAFDLESTGAKPTFCREPYEHGIERLIRRTPSLWSER